MDNPDIVEILSVFLLGATRFLWAPGTAIVAGFSFSKTIFVTSLGGIAGSSFFYFFGSVVIHGIENWRRRVRKRSKRPQPKIFTRRSRRIIRLKRSFGLIGLVILTPCILSIPVGCIVAAKFYRHNKSTYPLLLLSSILWAVVLTTIFWNISRF